MGKEKLTLAVVLGALALTGCASTLKGATERGGVVEYTNSTAAALKTAETHCQRFGRHAAVSTNSVVMGTMTFDCAE